MRSDKFAGENTLKEYQEYLKEYCKKEDISLEELFMLYNNSCGEEKINIRNRIVEYNLPLVVSFLWKKYNYCHDLNPVYDLDDVIQEANLILINAVAKYDKEKGTFSNFVYTVLYDIYFCNGIPNTAINFNRSKTNKYKKLKRYIDLEYDNEYISSKTGISIDKLIEIRPLLTNSLSCEEIFESLISEEFTEENSKFIYDDINICRVLESENINLRNETILNSLNQLTERQKKLVIAKFDLDGKGKRTDVQIAKEIGCHRKSIYYTYRVILKNLARIQELREMYDLIDTDYDYETRDKTYYLQK